MQERVKEQRVEARRGPRADNRVRHLGNLRHLWPVAFALKALTAADEARIGALVKKAVS